MNRLMSLTMNIDTIGVVLKSIDDPSLFIKTWKSLGISQRVHLKPVYIDCVKRFNLTLEYPEFKKFWRHIRVFENIKPDYSRFKPIRYSFPSDYEFIIYPSVCIHKFLIYINNYLQVIDITGRVISSLSIEGITSGQVAWNIKFNMIVIYSRGKLTVYNLDFEVQRERNILYELKNIDILDNEPTLITASDITPESNNIFVVYDLKDMREKDRYSGRILSITYLGILYLDSFYDSIIHVRLPGSRERLTFDKGHGYPEISKNLKYLIRAGEDYYNLHNLQTGKEYILKEKDPDCLIMLNDNVVVVLDGYTCSVYRFVNGEFFRIDTFVRNDCDLHPCTDGKHVLLSTENTVEIHDIEYSIDKDLFHYKLI